MVTGSLIVVGVRLITRSQQPQALKTRDSFGADDNVIMNSDSKRPASIGDRAGHLDIVFTGAGMAARVIMHENDRPGADLERALHHFARENRRVIDRAALMHFFDQQMVFAIEEQKAELTTAVLCARKATSDAATASLRPNARRHSGGALSNDHRSLNSASSSLAIGFTSRRGMAANSSSSRSSQSCNASAPF